MKRNTIGRIGYYKVVLSLLLVISAGGPLYGQTSRRVHVVQSGETLYRIGKQYGVSVAELYRLNPSARQGIRVGEELILPSTAAVAPAHGGSEFYDVKKGDTLYSIARRFGATVKEVMALNSFLKSPDDIATGMIIKVPTYPGASGTTSAPQKRVVPAAADSLNGVRMETVTAGATVYSLVKGTPWSEEDFYKYNPQVQERGLRAGESVFLPDGSIHNNLAAKSMVAVRPSNGSGVLNVVLALPFKQDRERRFADYYEGFLLSVLEAKRAGKDINLYVYDCGDVELPSTKLAISRLDDVDLVIGGVSMSSISQLSDLSKYKQAAFVVPFSSRDLSLPGASHVYQVNTPSRILFDRAAEKFVDAYATYHVLFVGALPGEEESAFVRVLKNRLRLAGVAFTDCPSSGFTTAEDAYRLSTGHARLVVVPASTSLAAARQVIGVIRDAREGLSDSSVLTAFGYPEWQTYASTLGRQMYQSEATFFTTFYIYHRDRSYQSFASDYMKWYGHGTGNTFPRYSALGYDTGSYFLKNPSGAAGPHRGVQTLFDYSQSSGVGVRSNGGVFFVRFNKDNSVSRF